MILDYETLNEHMSCKIRIIMYDGAAILRCDNHSVDLLVRRRTQEASDCCPTCKLVYKNRGPYD